jgi:hypothetical protein
MKLTALRAIPAGILAGASAVLAGAAKFAEIGARRLAPPSDRGMPHSEERPAAPDDARPETDAATTDIDTDAGTATAPVTTSVEPGPETPEARAADIADDGEARTYESHIAELAEQNVAAVVRGIQDLSTEELGELFDYESAHRKRRTVLQAIERAAAPPPEEQTAPPSDEQTVTSTPE